MPKVLESEGPLYLPTREDAAINQLFDNALPCPRAERASVTFGRS